MGKGKVIMAVAGVIVAVLLGVWTAVGYRDTRGIETPKYTVERKTRDFEVRKYAPQIRAEVVMDGDYRESLYDGFRHLADYIFGNNTTQSGIAMTAPVLSEQSAKIAMTAPVLHERQGAADAYVIAFIMPSEYTLDTLPQPRNDKVSLREIPGSRYAAYRFGGYATKGRAKRLTARLDAAIAREGLTAKGAPAVAQYNPPWTPPYMRRNEILIPIE